MRRLLFVSVFAIIFVNSPSINAQFFIEGPTLPNANTNTSAIGDVNGDGHNDILEGITAGGDSVLIYANDGNNEFNFLGSFGSQITSEIVLRDMDEDGDLDALVGTENSNNWVYFNDGNGNFTQQDPIGGGDITSILVNDFDGDNDLDIFLGNDDLGTNDYMFINQGTGQWFLDNSIPWTTGSYTEDAILEDINQDGNLDIVLAKGEAPTNIRRENEVWFSNGDGTWIKSPQIFPLVESRRCGSGDFNNDGEIDLIFLESGLIRIYLNDGTDVYQISTVAYNPPPFVRDVVFFDVDLDSNIDIVTLLDDGAGVNTVEVIFNDGNGNFGDTIETPLITDVAVSLDHGDIDGDGDTDLIVNRITLSGSIILFNQADILSTADIEMKDQVFAYPNPTKDFLIIDSKFNEIESLKIFDITGKLIETLSDGRHEIRLQVQDWNSGVYLLEYTLENGATGTSKFIKI